MVASPDAEVAVVGGGPAGSATALFLLARAPALHGRVHVFEKRRHPREKRCGGALSAWGLAHLRALGLADRVTGVPIQTFGLRMDDRVQRVAHAGLAIVVRRAIFDAMLFHAAAEHGAVTHEDAGVTALAREGDLWRIETSRGAFRARVIVGADGSSGGMRRLLGIPERSPRAQLAIVETPGPEARDGVSDGTLLFDLSPIARGVPGYYWDFPSPLDGTAGTSRGIFDLRAHGSQGAHGPRGAHGARDGAAARAAFDDALRLRSVDPATAKRKPWSIRPYTPGATVSVPGALLAGEAVGVDPVTGEGIAHALEYGRLAADEIAEALATGDLGFPRWTRRIEGAFVGRHLRQSCRLAPWVYGPRGALWARALVSSPTLVARGLNWYAGGSIGVTDAMLYTAVLAREGARALVT